MADSATVQVLKDTADALIVKLTMEQGDATPEAHVEKINVATLSCATWNLLSNGTPTGVGVNGFIAGEHITGNTSGADAVVVSYRPAANTLYVVNVVGAFANSEVIRGALSNSTLTLAAASAQVAPYRSLDIESIEYAIAQGGRVSLEWEGTIYQNSNTANVNAYFVTSATLFGSGYIGKNALASLTPQPVTQVANSTWTFASNGSLAVSTAGLVANGGYSLILEMRKGEGFSVIPDERFRDK